MDELDRDLSWQEIQEQIKINQARTPTERMLALFELLDAQRARAAALQSRFGSFGLSSARHSH